MNDMTKMAMEGILVEGMAFLVFQAHVESESQELFLWQMEAKLFEHHGWTPSMSFDMAFLSYSGRKSTGMSMV